MKTRQGMIGMNGKKGLRVEIDFHEVKATMVEVIDYVNTQIRENPDREYYMDGDLYAIVSKPRAEVA